MKIKTAPWETLAELPMRFLETGLAGMDSALRSLSAALPGNGLGDWTEPPLAGPPDAEQAAADLANRVTRILRRADLSPARLLELPRELLDAAGKSFPRGALDAPWRLLTLPAEAPLAVASLAVQQALRGLVVSRTIPAERLPDFLAFAGELFSDLHVYFSLQYGEELERCRERVRREPENPRSRLELGRTLMKCGLFAEALPELEAAAADPILRRRALYEKTVAGVRAGRFAAALADGAAAMAAAPEERARWWLFLAAQEAGGYPDTVPAEHRMEVVSGRGETAVELEDVAVDLRLDKVSGGRGTAVFDAHGDGFLDVVVAGAHAGLSLYRNRGDGTFEDVSTGSGLDACVYAFAVAAGDYDNDGRIDLYVTGLGFFNGRGILLRNDGRGADGRVTFTDVTEEAGIGCWGPGFHLSWVDYDNDGRLDLFVGNNAGGLFDRKTPNRLFHNDGPDARGRFTFTEVAAEAGLVTPWPTLGAVWADFRNVGLPDLFLSNFGTAQMFRNNGPDARGQTTFTDVSRAAGVDEAAIGSVAFACDYDDDGWIDVVQCIYSRPQEAIHTLRTGRGPQGALPLRIWHNNRDGTFTRRDRDIGLDGTWGTMSANAGDFDNDGRLDLLLGNGDPQMDRTEPAVLLANGGGHFRDVTFTAGLPLTGKGHGVNFADLNGDGRLHLIVGTGGLYPGDLLTTAVYRPKRRPGHYLNVRLVGTASNRDAIGARLVLTAGGRDQHRLVSGGSNFGCLPCEQHFGLGELTAADTLAIRWPSGQEQRLDSPPVDTTIRIVEGRPGWEPVYRRQKGA